MQSTLDGLHLIVLTVSAIGVALVILSSHLGPAATPHPVRWNSEICAHCGMIVGNQQFAAQMETADGQRLNFDDPGCLMVWLTRHHATPRAIYFHPLGGQAWMTLDETGFVPVPRSPAGFALGAVARSTPGALSWEEAVKRAQRQDRTGSARAGAPAPFLVRRIAG